MKNTINREAFVDASDHVGKLRQGYKLWNDTKGGSVAEWMALMADDVVMRGPSGAGLEFAGCCTGKEAAGAYFTGLATEWEMIHFIPEEFIAQGDRVVVLSKVSFRSRRTGKVAESPKADVFRFRDGQIVEFFEFFDTAAALAGTQPD